MKKRLFIIILSVATILAIGLGIFFQYFRSKVEPKQSEVQNVTNQAAATVDQVSDSVNSLVSTVTDGNSDTVDTTENTDTSTFRLNTFEIETLGQNQYVLQVNSDQQTTFPVMIDDLTPILDTPSDTYNSDQNFYLVDYSSKQLYYLGLGLKDQVKIINLGGKSVYFLTVQDLSGSSTIYTIDKDIKHFTKYIIPIDDYIQSINIDSKNSLQIVSVKSDGTNTQSVTTNFGLENLNKTEPKEISDENTTSLDDSNATRTEEYEPVAPDTGSGGQNY